MLNVFSLMKGFLSLYRNAFKSRPAILALQEKKLRKLLSYAYAHSAYYRRRFSEAGITADQLSTLPLTAFPTMDKHELIAHFDELVTDKALTQEALIRFDADAERENCFLGKYHVVHSSGSTGTPNYFVYDKKAWSTVILGILRGALWDMSLWNIVRLLAGRPRVLYIAATDGRYGGAMSVGDGIDGVGARQLFLDINMPIDTWIQRIKAFQPNFVIGYPSAIRILAELACENKIQLRLLRVVSCGEPLASGMRRYLEKALKAQVINFYGASESLPLGVEGYAGGGMALFDDLNVIEVVNGQMYVTCLYNTVQPLIRYHLSDCLTLKEQSGAFTRAEVILGRDEDVMWFEKEVGQRDFLHPLAVEGFCIEGLTDYQFVQTGKDAFTMLTVVEEKKQAEIQAEMLRRMRAILSQKRLDWVNFSIDFVRAIPPDQTTGKKRLILKSAA